MLWQEQRVAWTVLCKWCLFPDSTIRGVPSFVMFIFLSCEGLLGQQMASVSANQPGEFSQKHIQQNITNEGTPRSVLTTYDDIPPQHTSHSVIPSGDSGSLHMHLIGSWLVDWRSHSSVSLPPLMTSSSVAGMSSSHCRYCSSDDAALSHTVVICRGVLKDMNRFWWLCSTYRTSTLETGYNVAIFPRNKLLNKQPKFFPWGDYWDSDIVTL